MKTLSRNEELKKRILIYIFRYKFLRNLLFFILLFGLFIIVSVLIFVYMFQPIEIKFTNDKDLNSSKLSGYFKDGFYELTLNNMRYDDFSNIQEVLYDRVQLDYQNLKFNSMLEGQKGSLNQLNKKIVFEDNVFLLVDSNNLERSIVNEQLFLTTGAARFNYDNHHFVSEDLKKIEFISNGIEISGDNIILSLEDNNQYLAIDGDVSLIIK